MNPLSVVFLTFGFIAVGVLLLPAEQLPHKASTSARLLFGCLLLIAGGVNLGRIFFATTGSAQ